MSQPVVTLIPPKRVDLQLGGKSGPVMKRLVCGYARVSTDDPEQLTSYEAQIDAFTKLIQENDEWEFVGMYADVDMSYGQKPNEGGKRYLSEMITPCSHTLLSSNI